MKKNATLTLPVRSSYNHPSLLLPAPPNPGLSPVGFRVHPLPLQEKGSRNQVRKEPAKIEGKSHSGSWEESPSRDQIFSPSQKSRVAGLVFITFYAAVFFMVCVCVFVWKNLL